MWRKFKLTVQMLYKITTKLAVNLTPKNAWASKRFSIL